MAAAGNIGLLLLLSVCFTVLSPPAVVCSETEGNATGGRWVQLRRSIGVSAMHIALLPNGKVVIYDRTDFGPSNISLPSGRCRNDSHDMAVKFDCTAHSVEFDPNGRRFRPLTVLTDVWCSSGALTLDGVLVQTGGFNDGDHAVRYLTPCDDGKCDWTEVPDGLAVKRWYASNQILPDGRTSIVVGGRRQFNYEFVPKEKSPSDTAFFDLPFLYETRESAAIENNLYPFLHLSPDGNLFVFANNKSILLDYTKHVIVRRFPDMPGGAARNYPSTGSSVLLPLQLGGGGGGSSTTTTTTTSTSLVVTAEVMICGGTPPLSMAMVNQSVFLPASDTCGRLRITDESPSWEMETMPLARTMGDMLLLPNGDMLIINGAGTGTAGWVSARKPVLSPVLYRTGATYGTKDSERTFVVLNPSATPRMYHSTAILIPDGRVLVGGSNPNVKYDFTGVLFPTDLSIEAFFPPYLDGGARPTIMSVAPAVTCTYGQKLTVTIVANGTVIGSSELKVTMVAPSFNTHSFSMNQRLLVLRIDGGGVRWASRSTYELDVFAPDSAALAPPGYYMLFVVHEGVPSRAMWVHIK